VVDLDDASALLDRLLHERAGELVEETCAWSVGLSDLPHWEQRDGRVVPSGDTLGIRAATGQELSAEGTGRFSLGGALPGSFQDALNALAPGGGIHADGFDEEVLAPFALSTGVAAAERLRTDEPREWEELLAELGEDGSDLPAVVRALEWDVTLKAQAERLVLDALGGVPLVQVEAEGAPLAVVRAAERATGAAAAAEPAQPQDPDPGALFLAEAALRASGLAQPVRPEEAQRLLDVLLAEGLEPQEVLLVLEQLPVLADTVERISDALRNNFLDG
jgi:hypothetical protein